MSDEKLKVYDVWDRPTRWFHWINVLAVFGLIGLGLVILNADSLGVSTSGKILLKKTHVWVGYVFIFNLLFRLFWGFFGNRYTRWGGILPGGFGYFSSVRDYIKGFLGGRPKRYLGHNPLGKIGIAIMLLFLLIQALTGLVLAGTDIFYPPFGGLFADWIAADGIDPNSLLPYAREMYDEQAYQDMRAFRDYFITTHVYTFYALAAVIFIHVTAVIVTEVREGGTLISAMFTGRKIIAGAPQDLDDPMAAGHDGLHPTPEN